MDKPPLPQLPGAELVATGLTHLQQGKLSVEALLVAIARPRLERVGIDVPKGVVSTDTCLELQLYRLLRKLQPKEAYSRYNALLRRLASYEHAVEFLAEREKRKQRGVGAFPQSSISTTASNSG